MSTREIDGRTVEFGTTGYTNNFVFVLFDRDTDSIWHPMSDGSFDAVAGARKGLSLPFEAKPEPQPLAEWVAAHPDTTVMLPSQQDADWLRGRSNRPYLGVQLEDTEAGLRIVAVVAGSGAEDAQLQAGDIFVSVAGEGISDRSELGAVMSERAIGDVIEIVVSREGREFRCEATLGTRPAN